LAENGVSVEHFSTRREGIEKQVELWPAEKFISSEGDVPWSETLTIFLKLVTGPFRF
jgi:hypothetical protein